MASWPTAWPPFLFGAATSSHQIEGNQQNDWTDWEESGHGVEPSGRATDHWERWADDLALFKSLGLNAYRFSLEWSRIEPEPGQFDRNALAQYRAMILRMRELGLQPLLTLHHFTFPRWVAKRGGFVHPEAHQWFNRYTTQVMRHLGDIVDLFVTTNEPMVLVVMGYLIALWPPGGHGFRRAFRLIDRLVDAHRAAYRTIKDFKPDAWVGVAHHLIAFHPWTQLPWDRATAAVLRHLMNDRFMDKVGAEQDFIGVNYYTRQYGRLLGGLHPVQSRPGMPLTDLGWEIYPQGLLEVLRRVGRFRRPILITENGIATSQDQVRSTYIRDHLSQVAIAQQEGLDIRGYFYWSALDNFEWAEGYRPRFGLIGVNYDTLERNLRPSAAVYRAIIEANRGQYPISVPSILSPWVSPL
ncbi:glycoside hydrolase family 1 protein [Sulfobacillus harzensis]|uniref:Glycoside hydrolase family 1 protein n=1 Tax=Sulfobacillus harzensis TaxID=2729629 RepID=A0A7Y0L2R9_9FIRM|nr:glycoside hydrolase family 1 protein [Sulfobacillus harzensis]NMP21330.1 glycoside hydrolase family 1 protein [Sulfobacillus harzensis]